MTPDPAFLYQTPAHREALASLLYAVLEEKGFIVLTGDAGTGKTTLLSRMLRMIPRSKAVFSLVLNPTLNADEFMESVMLDFGIGDVPSSKARRILKFQQFLLAARKASTTCVLVVDEAHKLSIEVLEEIRLLTNFENAERKLLQIVLAGQPELRGTLNSDNLRQLKQRIAVRCELWPLSASEVTQYINFRWFSAGGRQKPPFDPDAIQIFASVSGGVPRVINALCDNVLVLIYGLGDSTATATHARQVVRDLDLGDEFSIVAPGWQTDRAQNGISNGAHLNLPDPVPLAASKTTNGFRVRLRIRR